VTKHLKWQAPCFECSALFELMADYVFLPIVCGIHVDLFSIMNCSREVVPIHDMKAYGGSIGIVPLIPHIISRRS